MVDDDRFLSRWAKRKAEAKARVAPPPAVTTPSVAPLAGSAPAAEAPVAPQPEPAAPPLPTLADVAALTPDSDYSRFVAAGVDEGVKRAALKKLFSDPHFNVMDGLDTYIEDYNLSEPIPASMLRRMWQSKSLGLFDEEEAEPAAQASTDGAASVPVSQSAIADTPTESAVPPDEDPDLRLQPDDDPGRPGPGAGARRREG